MRWVDDFIDRRRARWLRPPGPFRTFGFVGEVIDSTPLSPFSRVASVFNALACGLMVVGGVMLSVAHLQFLFFLAFALGMETVFIRTAVRVYRGDFDRDRSTLARQWTDREGPPADLR